MACSSPLAPRSTCSAAPAPTSLTRPANHYRAARHPRAAIEVLAKAHLLREVGLSLFRAALSLAIGAVHRPEVGFGQAQGFAVVGHIGRESIAVAARSQARGAQVQALARAQEHRARGLHVARGKQ